MPTTFFQLLSDLYSVKFESEMSLLNFTKLSGSGNDFVLFDQKLNKSLDINADFIKKICERRTCIGADGVIVFSDSEKYPFEMTYYNSDGSTGSLCANGARCSLQYGYITGRISNELVIFISNGIEYSGQIIGKETVKFFLNSPKDFKYNFKIKAAGQLINASFVDTGSPHIVIKLNEVLKNPDKHESYYRDLNELSVIQIGREIRYSKDFAPNGTNVNFIDIKDDVIKIRSYERGVEDETLSCGTGIVASGLISYVNDRIKQPIKFLAKSGDILVVDFKVDDQKVSDLSLTGPAKVVFNGEIST